MDSSEPQPTSAEPAPREVLPEQAIIGYLRGRAPGLPAVRFNARAVTSRARRALRRRRRIRNSALAATGASMAYLLLAVAGPVPVPGLGTVTVPGGSAVHGVVVRYLPGAPPGPDRQRRDVERLDAEVLPLVESLQISSYLLEPGTCRILEYARGSYSDRTHCEELTPFDAQAVADFNTVTNAVRRSGVPVDRIGRIQDGIYVQLKDSSWQYNYEYVDLPDETSPPATIWPEERWTRIRGHWWFHRAHDD